MTTTGFLSKLRAQGIELRAEGEKLVVNAPKGALTEELGTEVRRRKSELLTFLRMGTLAAAAGAKSRVRIPVAELRRTDRGALEAPLSSSQRRLFYLDQLEPGLAVYNVPIAFWLSGPLNEDALSAAIGDIIERHSVLRTTLALGSNDPVQRVAAAMPIDMPILRLVDEQTAEALPSRLQEFLLERARESFDLSSGPLFRTTLIQTAPEEHVLLVASHHVVTDGWSQDVFERDLLEMYHARVEERAPVLPELSIQYVDYAAWQTNAEVGAARKDGLAYWRERLALPLPVLELPTAHARPSMAPTEGETTSTTLPRDLVAPLSALGQRDGATLFMVLLAAYATLLNRITGQDEIVIGTPVANRIHEQTQELMGFFANTLALRVDLSGAPTFRELLRRVREVCLGAYAQQDIPFEELVETLEVERDLSRTPIFQTMFAFEDAMPTRVQRADRSDGRSLRVSRRESIHAKVARMDLSAWVSASEAGLRITLEYPTALFDATAMERLLGHFRVLLRGIADGADGEIEQLPILSADERYHILETWNDTYCALPDVVGAHELFERSVERNPEQVALTVGDRNTSYRSLEEQANRLANYLRSVGVCGGTLVGVFLGREANMLVAILAIMKAGGTYVPLDPAYPADRLAFMFKDSKLKFVLTGQELSERVPDGVRAIAFEQCRSEIEACSMERPPRSLSGVPSESPCYVIYTSGSTGRPKGVVVPHRGFVNFLVSMSKSPGMDERDVLVAVTTLSFDIAGLELLLPLAVGARIVMASVEDAGDGHLLRRILEQHGATVMQATPATWRLLVDAGWSGSDGFKALVGGEAFPSDLLVPLCERVGSLWNMYGPTETTVWSTCTRLDATDPRITVGRPIDNTSIYILDRRAQPVPVGVPGELAIGGLGVTLGYLDRPELTDERFVADPFRQADGALMYRTGDLAAFRSDGTIVYHRRLDHQVKVRGYRIEPGEIETVLCEHTAVASCVVIVREDRPGDVRLVAYIVANRGMTVTTTEVRKHLRERLPDYMIPQHVVELDALPLTPAGKIARANLPVPGGAVPPTRGRPPTSPSELLLAQIWREVLGLEQVSATDNFFEIGGHSLLSMSVVARVLAETGTRISPRSLLLNTLEHVASQFEVSRDGDLSGPTHATNSVGTVEQERGVQLQPSEAAGTRAREGGMGGLVSRIKGRIFG